MRAKRATRIGFIGRAQSFHEAWKLRVFNADGVFSSKSDEYFDLSVLQKHTDKEFIMN